MIACIVCVWVTYYTWSGSDHRSSHIEHAFLEIKAAHSDMRTWITRNEKQHMTKDIPCCLVKNLKCTVCNVHFFYVHKRKSVLFYTGHDHHACEMSLPIILHMRRCIIQATNCNIISPNCNIGLWLSYEGHHITTYSWSAFGLTILI